MASAFHRRILKEAVLRHSGCPLSPTVSAGNPSFGSDAAASPQHSPHPQSATSTHSADADFAVSCHKRTTLKALMLSWTLSILSLVI